MTVSLRKPSNKGNKMSTTFKLKSLSTIIINFQRIGISYNQKFNEMHSYCVSTVICIMFLISTFWTLLCAEKSFDEYAKCFYFFPASIFMLCLNLAVLFRWDEYGRLLSELDLIIDKREYIF